MSERVSLLSYNILYPNTEGWWIDKCYSAHEPPEVSAWPHRRRLLVDQLGRAEADIICLQETASSSFHDDFAPLDLTYERVIHAKGMRMRCATFWRRGRFEVVEVKHKYRSLVTLLKLTSDARLILIINVHLSGGPQPKERVNQVDQALEQGRKLLQDHLSTDDVPRLIICGDFNTDLSESALGDFLASGLLSPEVRDVEYPDVALTSRGKRHSFAPLRHASCLADPRWEQAFARADQTSSPSLCIGRSLSIPHTTRHTLQVPNLIHHFCQQRAPSGVDRVGVAGETPEHALTLEILRARRSKSDAFHRHLKPEFYTAMRELFEQFADERRARSSHETGELDDHEELLMSPAGATRWLQTINGELRGSEHRAWLRISALQTDQRLTFAQWVEILIEELKSGKWWAVAHDLHRCDVAWPPLNDGQSTLHRERLDHIVFGGALTPVSWCQSALFDELERYYHDQRPIPHADHPSDHFPVQATFVIDQV